ASPLNSSISGNPSDAGVSRMKCRTAKAPAIAIPAGTRKQGRQPYRTTRNPVSADAPAAPIECDVFQIPNIVGRSDGLNQWLSVRAHGGNPIPCPPPLSTQKTPIATTGELNPNATLHAADSTSPSAMK